MGDPWATHGAGRWNGGGQRRRGEEVNLLWRLCGVAASYLARRQGAADLLATPLFRRPLDDDPILRYFDTSILQCFDASCRLLRLDASLLRCFEASMPRCSIRESAREKERAREQARPRIPGPRIPGPRTGRQAGREQAGRQAENRQAENRQRTGNYEVQVLG